MLNINIHSVFLRSSESKMAAMSVTCETTHVSPSSRELMLSQVGCLPHDQGQMLGVDLGLMEMPEAEYTQLQHLIQANVEEAHAGPTEGPDARAQPAAVMVKEATGSTTAMSPFTTTQAIDLSTSTDKYGVVMPGEKTPASSYGEVPGNVLAKMRDENSPREPPACSRTAPLRRPGSSARVCLEKRFNTTSADTDTLRNKDAAVLSK